MAKQITWTDSTRKLTELVPWERNPRQIKGANVKRLQESFEEFGQPEPVIIGPNDELYNGHQRLKSWLSRFGDVEVAVRVASRPLTEKEREKLTVYLHRGATGEWDFDILANEFEIDELLEWGFESFELGLGDSPLSPVDDPGPQTDRAEELRQKWGVESGQLWKLGEHRLICGDCTDPAVVERLMGGERADMIWTDPPYGVAIGDKNKFLNSIAPSNRIEENLQGDTLDEAGIRKMLDCAFWNAAQHCTPGASWYVAAPAGPPHIVFGEALRQIGVWRQTIQWVKNNATLSPMGVCYHWQAEPIFFGWLPNGPHKYYGGRQQTTVWEIDRPSASSEHPTMKPIGLVARAVANSSQPRGIVLDLFSGSGTTIVACEDESIRAHLEEVGIVSASAPGTTIIACETLARRARAIEISPAYVAVTLERFQQATGQTPESVNE